MNSNLRTFWENRYQIGTSSPTKGRIRPFSVNTDRFGYTGKDLERHYNQTDHHHHPTTIKLFEALTIAFMMLGRSSTLTDVIKIFFQNFPNIFSEIFQIFFQKFSKYFFKNSQNIFSKFSKYFFKNF